jgi:hypothetical protein
MSRTYMLTYGCITPESAAAGDTSDHGFGHGDGYRGGFGSTSMAHVDATYPRGSAAWLDAVAAARDAATATIEPDAYDVDDYDGDESAAAVALVVGVIRREYGATEPSNSSGGPGTWFTQPDGSTDYRTGEVCRVSIHLDGWTPAEQAAIYRAVTGR